jgi:hypothetical protein
MTVGTRGASVSTETRRARLGLIDLLSREGVDDRTVWVQRLLAEIDLELAVSGDGASGRCTLRGDPADALDEPVDLL